MRTLSTAFALVAAASLAVPALATEATAIRVQYSDLDLSSPRDKAILDRRIEDAVRPMCGTGVSTGTLLPDRAVSQCMKNAKAAVHKSIADRVVIAERGSQDRAGG